MMLCLLAARSFDLMALSDGAVRMNVVTSLIEPKAAVCLKYALPVSLLASV